MSLAEDKVLSVLMNYGSLSGIEIMSLTDIPDTEVSEAVQRLAERNLVSVSRGERIEDQAVTIQTKGLAAASQARYSERQAS